MYPASNGFSFIPASKGHFIATHMEQIRLKQFVEFAVYSFQNFIHFWIEWIQNAARRFHTVVPPWLCVETENHWRGALILETLPTFSNVRRSVDFR